MKRKQTREKRLHKNRHPGRGWCPYCHVVGRRARRGQRSARSAALNVGHYEDAEDFKWFGDRFNYTHWYCNPYHGKNFKSNRHINSTRRREMYRKAARRKTKFYGR